MRARKRAWMRRSGSVVKWAFRAVKGYAGCRERISGKRCRKRAGQCNKLGLKAESKEDATNSGDEQELGAELARIVVKGLELVSQGVFEFRGCDGSLAGIGLAQIKRQRLKIFS
jgi:hypothetical protein